MGIFGQDWASYQSANPSVTGIDYAFSKATEGLGYTNPKFAAQRAWAKQHGLVFGSYHYPHMHNNPTAEADYFLSVAKPQPGEIVVLDWEGYDPNNAGVTNAQKVAYRDAWLKYVKGKLPNNPVGMYCNTDYWLNVDKTSNCGDFLWIATAGKQAGQPGIQHAWTFHQYSTAGGIDHDYANFATKAALVAWVNSFTKTPPPENDMTPAESKLLTQAAADAAAAKTSLASLQAQLTALQTAVTVALSKLPGELATDIAQAVKTTGITATVEVNGTVK